MVGVVAGGGLALLYPLFRPGLLTRQPRQRANALLGWAVAPACLGLFFTTLLFVPSILKRLGIPAGHCHNHAERLPHICLTNPLISGSEISLWNLVAALSLFLACFWAAQGAQLHKLARLKSALRCAKEKTGTNHSLIPWGTPAAITVGFWTPKIFVSKSLAQSLLPGQLQVILAHEQAHVRYRDPLRQSLAQALSALYLAQPRRRLLDDLALATEQACDEEAAQKIGDRLLVAETIVAVERLLHRSQRNLAPLVVGFVGSNSALRIEALLADGEYSEPSFPDWLLLSPPLAVTHLVMPGPLHYLSELIIRH